MMDDAKFAAGVFVVLLIGLFMVAIFLFNLISRMRQERRALVNYFEVNHPSLQR
jgi:hypothetical protein